MIESDENFKRLRHAEFELAPREISNYACAVKSLHGPGFALVGNATEFLDPVFSSGVTLALESANRASKTLIRQLRGEPVDWEADYAGYMKRGIDVFRTYVSTWYDGSLPRILYSLKSPDTVKKMICSVLAGYVWDETNPFVAQHQRKVAQVARLVGQ
jgi:flavin-dependent dehydrogenase